MTITYFPHLEQGTDEWKAARCGLLTASEMHLIVTPPAKPKPPPKNPRKGPPPPPVKPAMNDKERAHLYELLSQRITGYVEVEYISDHMLRGYEDEITALALYAKKRRVNVTRMGFVTNDRWGFTLGYSPDGLVGDDGLAEAKSRLQKFQLEVILEHFRAGTAPREHVIQCQTALLVTERKWLDYLSYCGGFHLVIIRIHPIPAVQQAILEAASGFEQRLAARLADYQDIMAIGAADIFETDRRPAEQDIIL